MKFTTFLSLALHALLICQFNPLFSMKRKRESISPNPAKQQKIQCPQQGQDSKKTDFNWTNYGSTLPTKNTNENPKSGMIAFDKQTGGEFKKRISSFTVAQSNKKEAPINAIPQSKARKQNSSFHPQQRSILEVPTHQQPTDNQQNASQQVDCDPNKTSQYSLPPLEFLRNLLKLTPQENKSINTHPALQQVINIHNNYNIIVTPPVQQNLAVSNIPLNHPTTNRPATIQTESCGIEMPRFDFVPPEFYLNFPHLPGAGVTIQGMPSTLVACSSCQKKFTSHQDMKKHAVSAHLECPQLECTYRDSTASGLMVHTMQQHFHEHVSIFPCIHCNAFAATDIQEKNAHRQYCSLTRQYSYGNN